MRKTPAGCGLLFWGCLSSMCGSALLAYALIALHGAARWLALAGAAFFLGMAAMCLYIIRLAHRFPDAVPPPTSVQPFPAADSLTYDDVLSRLMPYMESYFTAAKNAPHLIRLSAPPQFERLIWPCWFIEVVDRYDEKNFSALLAVDKTVIDFICDGLFNLGMDDAVRRLQYYRASAPALDAEARAWFRAEAPHMKEIVVQHVREHIDEYQPPA